MKASRNLKKAKKDSRIIKKGLILVLFRYQEMEANTHKIIDDIFINDHMNQYVISPTKTGS